MTNTKILNNALFVMVLGATSALAQNHASVLEMKPIGYWPSDEGQGEVLHDLSDNVNHGLLRRVPWDADNKLLDFTGAYQWAEIPSLPRYQTKDFSIGAWVFTRSKVRGGLWGFSEGMTFIGNAYGDTGYTLDTLYDEPTLYHKSKLFGGGVPYDHRTNGVSICIRSDELVDIISGGKDAIGTRAAKIGIAIGQWQHVLYTYEAEHLPMEGGDAWKSLLERTEYRGETGTGTLYINGKPVQSKKGVPFAPRDTAFLIGSDAVWWLQASHGGGPLNGSVRDIVMFDRALPPEDIAQLSEATRPNVQPSEIADADKNDTSAIAAKPLLELIAVIRDKTKPETERAEAALAVAAMKAAATDSVPTLVAALDECLKQDEKRLPRVEELLRNAATRALLDIAPNRPEVSVLLERALPKADQEGERFFSQGDPHWDSRPNTGNQRAYTAVSSHDTMNYTLGPGESFNAVEPVRLHSYQRRHAQCPLPRQLHSR